MKKIFSLAVLFLFTVAGFSQNVQLHYDFGHSFYKDLTNRMSVTTTVEMFKTDKWGNNYFFVDIDYQKDGVMGAYWEISREMNLTANKQWAAHVEYDGGLTSDKKTLISTRFQHAALFGGAWNWASSDFS